MWPALLLGAGFALVLTAAEPITDGAAGSGILFFVTATDEHNGGLCDSDAMLREPIKAANAYSGSDAIRFSGTARSILGGVLPKTCLIAQCRPPINLEEVSFDCR
jgi:hypothetical protein